MASPYTNTHGKLKHSRDWELALLRTHAKHDLSQFIENAAATAAIKREEAVIKELEAKKAVAQKSATQANITGLISKTAQYVKAKDAKLGELKDKLAEWSRLQPVVEAEGGISKMVKKLPQIQKHQAFVREQGLNEEVYEDFLHNMAPSLLKQAKGRPYKRESAITDGLALRSQIKAVGGTKELAEIFRVLKEAAPRYGDTDAISTWVADAIARQKRVAALGGISKMEKDLSDAEDMRARLKRKEAQVAEAAKLWERVGKHGGIDKIDELLGKAVQLANGIDEVLKLGGWQSTEGICEHIEHARKEVDQLRKELTTIAWDVIKHARAKEGQQKDGRGEGSADELEKTLATDEGFVVLAEYISMVLAKEINLQWMCAALLDTVRHKEEVVVVATETASDLQANRNWWQEKFRQLLNQTGAGDSSSS